MLLIALLKNEYFPADHHLDDHVVLLEGLQLVVDVLALQYVGLRAHAQGHSHLAGNFLACLCFSSQFAKTSYIVFLFVKASSKQVWLVKEVLNLFYKVSSFEVNVSKSVYKVSIISLE